MFFSSTFRYTFKHLDKGYYSFRVRSISLAQKGRYTDYQFVTVYDESHILPEGTGEVALIGVSLACIFLLFVVYYLVRKMKQLQRSGGINESRQNIIMQMEEAGTNDEEGSDYQPDDEIMAMY